MLKFERIEDRHLPDILDIYNYYILNSTATFSIEPITPEEMKKIVYSGHERFLSYAVLDEGVIVGYVLLARYKAREAYDRTAEVTIYLRHDCIGKGYGKKALHFIEKIADDLEFRALLAVICAENEDSVQLFAKHGYFKCADFKQVGEKFGRILDVVIYEKLLR